MEAFIVVIITLVVIGLVAWKIAGKEEEYVPGPPSDGRPDEGGNTPDEIVA